MSYPLVFLTGVLLTFTMLHGADEVLKSERTPPWVKAYVTNAQALPPLGSTSDIYYLLADRQIHVEEDVRYYHYAYQMLTENGVQDYSQLSIPHDPHYETVTLHKLSVRRGGLVLNKLQTQEIKVLQRESGAERQLYDGRLSAMIILDDIRVGDVLEYAYSISGTNPVFDGHFFHSESTRWASPVHQSRFRLILSESRKVRYRNQGSPIEPQFRTQDGITTAELEEDNLPAILSEGDLPEGFFSHPWIEFSDFPDWQSVALWAAKQYPEKQELPDEIQRVLKHLELFKTEDERIMGALRWVQDNIRYVGLFQGIHSHKPYPLENCVTRRFGDCKDKSNLLAAMLRAMGFKCWIGLVSTSYRSAIRDWLPSPDVFNHAVVGVDTATGMRWLDATNSYQRGSLRNLHFPDYGWVLEINPGTTDLQRVKSAGLNEAEITTSETFTLEDYKGSARLTVITKYLGSQADNQRAYYASRSLDEIERAYLNHYAKQYPKIKALGRLTTQDDELNNQFTTTENYEIAEIWKPSKSNAETLQFELYAGIVGSELFLPSSRVRTMPFYVPHPRKTTQKIEVSFPSSLSLNNATEEIKNPAFNFEITEISSSAKTIISYRYESLKDEVSIQEAERYMADVQKVQDQLGYTFTIPTSYANLSPEELSTEVEAKQTKKPLWILVILCFLTMLTGMLLCAALYLWDPPARPRIHIIGTKLEGFGGWLLLFGIGAIVRPFLLIKQMYEGIYALDVSGWNALTQVGSANYHPLWEPVLLMDTVFVSMLIPISLLILVLFFKRRTSTPLIMAVFFVCLTLYHGLSVVVYNELPGIGPEYKTDASKTLLKSLFTIVVWVPYLFLSRRVRNTFQYTRKKMQMPPPLPEVPLDPSLEITR